MKLKTDSQFTINCVTMWLNKWRRNDYKLANGNDVKNREDLVKLDQAMSGIEIKWVIKILYLFLFLFNDKLYNYI